VSTGDVHALLLPSPSLWPRGPAASLGDAMLQVSIAQLAVDRVQILPYVYPGMTKHFSTFPSALSLRTCTAAAGQQRSTQSFAGAGLDCWVPRSGHLL